MYSCLLHSIDLSDISSSIKVTPRSKCSRKPFSEQELGASTCATGTIECLKGRKTCTSWRSQLRTFEEKNFDECSKLCELHFYSEKYWACRDKQPSTSMDRRSSRSHSEHWAPLQGTRSEPSTRTTSVPWPTNNVLNLKLWRLGRNIWFSHKSKLNWGP